MTEKFDIIIIGGGNAGFGVSAIAHDAGKTIAFIEDRDFGGTCPNRGCTPKKVLVAAAHTLEEIARAKTHCIEVGEPSLNWAALIDREKDLISFLPGAMESTAEKRGTLFRGTAKFTGPNTVEVDGKIIEGEAIVIATGSIPRPLPIPGADLMITSDDVLSDRELPSEVVFVGGGVIAMEFSHVYARAGSKVTILEALPRLLPRMDVDAVNAIQAETESLGVVIKTGVTVKQITDVDDMLRVDFEHEGQAQSVGATKVVNGAGRIANVGALDLEAANVKYDGVRIAVDDYLRSTSNPAVWVAGDALVHSAQLSPIATYEGRVVGENIVHGPTVKPNYDVLPSAVYTVPAVSTVGLTEEEAKAKGLNVKVTTSDMTGWLSGKTYGETVAFAKVLVDEKTDRFVGVHMVGHQSEELIHLFSLAMNHDISATAMRSNMFAFPTFTSDVKSLF
ncbi:MAG: NAD(P)/FAD-dependent oxidoreductase [Alphaproteobacteria bacterium]|nr:NAD(P)/FAD-dependent oxidoreductase [Alphaproteobacteria bacterium]